MLKLYPELPVIDRFATPLNAGERRVLDRLIEGLDSRDEDWHLAVQPSLPGAMPDFVLWAIHHGVTIIEVKNWNPANYSVQEGQLLVRDERGSHPTAEDPVAQAYRYKHFFANHVVYRPGNLPAFDQTFKAVKSVVMMPRFPRRDADSLVKSVTGLSSDHAKYIRVCGHESLDPDSRWAFDHLIFGSDSSGPGLEDRSFSRLTARFRSHAALIEQGIPLPLSASTRTVAEQPPTLGFRRVRGTAGSGKTVALAARAVRVAEHQERVLVLSFNITLAHYLQDLVRRDCRARGVDHNRIYCTYFHHLLRWEVLGDRANGLHPDEWPAEARRLLEVDAPSMESRFDAILVDEGQDFEEDWWLLLRKHFLRGNGEMLLVADRGQDIYSRGSWVDDGPMPGAGFHGPWMTLHGSQRMPTDLAQLVRRFVDTFLPDMPHELRPDAVADRQLSLEMPTVRRWVNVTSDDDCIEQAVQVVDRLVSDSDAPARGDVVILAAHSVGERVCARLESDHGLQIEHVFTQEDDDERRRRKHAFWAGVNEIKGSTIHSFKGWESAVVVMVLSSDMEAHDAARLAYIGMTRIREGSGAKIIVVNALGALASFGVTFDSGPV
jgi:hypothetical protein